MNPKYRRKNTNVEIVCKNCGRKAVVHSRKAVFCSRACNVKWHNSHRPSTYTGPETMECKVCGKMFRPFSLRSVFCSDECYKLFSHVKAIAQKTARNRARIGGDRKCLYCGKEFTPYNSRHVCCSAGCYANWKLSRKIGVDAVEGRLRYVSESRRCRQCGRMFVPRSASQYCCSKECGVRYRSRASACAMQANDIFGYALEVAAERQARIPEFERVAMMDDYDRLEAMKGWDEEKRQRFLAGFAKKRKTISLRSMVEDRKCRKAATQVEDAPR